MHDEIDFRVITALSKKEKLISDSHWYYFFLGIHSMYVQTERLANFDHTKLLIGTIVMLVIGLILPLVIISFNYLNAKRLLKRITINDDLSLLLHLIVNYPFVYELKKGVNAKYLFNLLESFQISMIELFISLLSSDKLSEKQKKNLLYYLRFFSSNQKSLIIQGVQVSSSLHNLINYYYYSSDDKLKERNSYFVKLADRFFLYFYIICYIVGTFNILFIQIPKSTDTFFDIECIVFSILFVIFLIDAYIESQLRKKKTFQIISKPIPE